MKQRIKKTYVCRNVENWKLRTSVSDYRPKVGDVGIFEVLSTGKHKNIQDETKRNAAIVKGDRIMAAFGTRYATAQFEGYVPSDANCELHILGAGGTIGLVKTVNAKFEGVGPTKLKMIGLAIGIDANVINTKKLEEKHLLQFTGSAAAATRVVLSLGSSMDSGKTTSAAYLVHGLKKAGMNVAYVKLTGTIYTKDADLAWDLGADAATDFGQFGFPSTYMCTETELLSLYESLLANVLPLRPDYVIMEIADGLYQRETRMLLNNYKFISTVDSVIFSAGDSMAAINGVQVLRRWGIYPSMLSGLLTTSPLLIREVRENTHIPVFTIEELADGETAVTALVKPVALATNQ